MRIAVCLCIPPLGLAILSCGSNGKSNSTVQVAEPKLSSIQRRIFDENCNAPSCHGSGRKSDLSLVMGNSYGQLVGVASLADKKNLPSFLRVKPGNPDSSILFIKVCAPDTNQGEVMPKGSDKLTQGNIDAIRQWILNGAPNN
jgi:hypothetical protein